jgi:multidrug efflux pump subunit AcrA (membrane-fusion protein)
MQGNPTQEETHGQILLDKKDIPTETEVPPTTNSRTRRLMALGGAGLLAAGVIGGLSLVASKSEKQAPSEPSQTATNAIPVETLKVEPVSSYQVQRSYTGEITARRTSKVGFERSGQLAQLFVEEGDRVTAGQPLAKLDTRNLQAQRQQLQAQRDRALAKLEQLQNGPRTEDIEAARANVRNLEKELQLKKKQRSRREYLYREGAISREHRDEFRYQQEALAARLDEARSRLQKLLNGTRQEEIAAQRATVRELEANINNIDVTLDKSVLKAPFTGTVSQRNFDEGTVVQAGQPVVRLVENSSPEARIGLPAQFARTLQPGTSQTVQVGSQKFSATVASILPEIDPQTRTQVVVLNLEAAAISYASPGQTVRLHRTKTIETQGYWVPLSALTQSVRGLWTCYVVVPSSQGQGWQVQQQTVEILHQNSDRAFVRGTLQANQRLVANGTHRLVPGQQVRPVTATANQPNANQQAQLSQQ